MSDSFFEFSNLLDRAHALQRIGHSAEALAVYQQLLAIDPHHVDALHDCGDLLFKTGSLAEALTCYENALEIAPRHLQILNNSALALSALAGC
jgi:tetratricopeptide (TPR) repeat protein